MFTTAAPPSSPSILRGQLTAPESTLLLPPNPTPWPGPGFKETAFLYAVSAAALTHTLARACSAGRMERCTCDDSPGLESRQAWQWGVCGDNLKYSTKFLNNFLGPKRGSKDLRARTDAHNTHVGIKVSASLGAEPGSRVSRRPVPPLLPPPSPPEDTHRGGPG